MGTGVQLFDPFHFRPVSDQEHGSDSQENERHHRACQHTGIGAIAQPLFVLLDGHEGLRPSLLQLEGGASDTVHDRLPMAALHQGEGLGG